MSTAKKMIVVGLGLPIVLWVGLTGIQVVAHLSDDGKSAQLHKELEAAKHKQFVEAMRETGGEFIEKEVTVRNCPYCKFPIPIAATKCGHCGTGLYDLEGIRVIKQSKVELR